MYSQRTSSFAKNGSSSSEARLPHSLYTDYLPELLSDQNLDEAFTRLTLAPYNNSAVYPSLDSLGRSQGSVLDRADGHRFLMGQMQESNLALQKLDWGYGGVADVGGMPSPNYLVGSDSWGLDKFWSGSYPTSDAGDYSSNYDWFLHSRFARQKEIGTTFPTVPRSNKDGLCFNLPPNSRVIYSRNRSNLSKPNINDSRPHCLLHPPNRHSVSNWRGSIPLLAKDQYGCRLLQEMMIGLTAEEISFIFLELIDHVSELMLHPFGNYVVQKLVEVCTEEQRTQIILRVTEVDLQLVSICLDIHGTRAVQKLLEHVTTQNQRAIITSALIPGAVELTKDMNGHHVIEHCLKHFLDEENKYLLNEVANSCFGIATDKSGCCVLQQCVNHAKGETKDRLMSEIILNALDLAEHCYGNYVVQHLISLKIAAVTESILIKLQGKFISLSCNKYGSNVVEKFFQESGEGYSRRIILELLQNRNVSRLLVDPFGNYVIQSALMVSEGQIHNAILKLIRLNSGMMRGNLFGRKLLAQCHRV